MAKRIVQEWLSDKTIRYRVETNRRLGFIPSRWHTDSQLIGPDCYGPALFNNLENAKEFIGIYDNEDPIVIHSSVIFTTN